MVKSLTAIFQQQAGKGALAPIKIVADDRTNALIILATENDTARIRELLNLMDKEIPQGGGHHPGLLPPERQGGGSGQGPDRPSPAEQDPTDRQAPRRGLDGAVFSKNVQIMADKATNSLIITADTADYLVIEDVIRKLDITRPMVYLEALIMEVNANKSFNVGVEWSMLKDVNISPGLGSGRQQRGGGGIQGDLHHSPGQYVGSGFHAERFFPRRHRRGDQDRGRALSQYRRRPAGLPERFGCPYPVDAAIADPGQ